MAKSKLVPLLLAALVLASGCLGAGGPTTGTATQTDTPTAAIDGSMNDSAVLGTVADATVDVERYAFTMNSTTRSSGFGNTSSTVTATVDRSAERARLSYSTTFDGEQTNTTAIVAGDTVYSERENGTWTRYGTESGLSNWQQFDRLSTFVELAQRSNATVVGTGTVDGDAVTRLEADVDTETYLAVMGNGNTSMADAETNVTATIRMAVDDETGLPLRVTVETTNSGEFGTTTTTATLTVESYGVDTDIQTPTNTVTVTPFATGSDGGETTVAYSNVTTIQSSE